MSRRAHRILGAVVAVGLLACGPTRASRRQVPPRDESTGDEQVMFPDEAAAKRRAERAPPATETVRRGEALLQKGKPSEAQGLFEKAIDADPEDLRAHLDLGLALEMQGQMEAAERAYRQALEIDPEFPEALNNLGLLLRKQDRLDEAAELLRQAVQVRSDFADAQRNLALTLEEAGELEQAADAYRKANRMDPEDPIVRANLGMILLEQGRREQAAIELREALPKARGNAAALQAIGNGLRRSRQFDAAVRAMRMAIEAHGTATPALLAELALAQRAAGDRKGAEQTLQRALDRDEGFATGHFLLGSMQAGRGAYGPAITHFERYLELAPDGPHAAKARERLEQARKAAQ